jgi:hypothetical protein
MAEIVQQCLDAHNEYRRKHGASPLVISQSVSYKKTRIIRRINFYFDIS